MVQASYTPLLVLLGARCSARAGRRAVLAALIFTTALLFGFGWLAGRRSGLSGRGCWRRHWSVVAGPGHDRPQDLPALRTVSAVDAAAPVARCRPQPPASRRMSTSEKVMAEATYSERPGNCVPTMIRPSAENRVPDTRLVVTRVGTSAPRRACPSRGRARRSPARSAAPTSEHREQDAPVGGDAGDERHGESHVADPEQHRPQAAGQVGVPARTIVPTRGGSSTSTSRFCRIVSRLSDEPDTTTAAQSGTATRLATWRTTTTLRPAAGRHAGRAAPP